MINFYVLTDANLKIGQGHLARSLDLAKAAVILNYNVIIYINGDFANITSPLLEVHLNSDWYDNPESIEIIDGVVLIDTYNNVDSLINKLLLSNNKVIKINDDKDKTKRIEKSIASYIKSQQPKDAKSKSSKRKSKEITKNAA